MMRAGLHNRKKKQMTYAVAFAVIFCSFGSALALDYYGVIKIPFLHSVTNFVVKTTNLPPPKRKLATWDDTDSVDPNEACKLMGNCPKKTKRKRRGNKKDKLLGVDLNGAFQGRDSSGNSIGRTSIGKDGMANIDPSLEKTEKSKWTRCLATAAKVTSILKINSTRRRRRVARVSTLRTFKWFVTGKKESNSAWKPPSNVKKKLRATRKSA